LNLKRRERGGQLYTIQAEFDEIGILEVSESGKTEETSELRERVGFHCEKKRG